MMNSEALRILATMTPVTVDTISERDIDVALMCYVPAIEDLNVRIMLIDTCDLMKDDADRTDAAFGGAVRIVNEMIAAR